MLHNLSGLGKKNSFGIDGRGEGANPAASPVVLHGLTQSFFQISQIVAFVTILTAFGPARLFAARCWTAPASRDRTPKMPDLSLAWPRTNGNTQIRIASLLEGRFGMEMPSYPEYMAFRQELVDFLVNAKGLADDQWVRKPLTAAMYMLYEGLPTQDTPDAIRKRRFRRERGSKPRGTVGGTKETPQAQGTNRTLWSSTFEALLNIEARHFELIGLEIVRLEFGAKCSDVEHTGGPSDRGVDGFVYIYGVPSWIMAIKPRRLVKPRRQKVGVQAKRWKRIVRPVQVHAFRGALDLCGLKYGVLFAVSGATPAAIEQAKLLSIQVVDGWQMAEMLIKHELGLWARQSLL